MILIIKLHRLILTSTLYLQNADKFNYFYLFTHLIIFMFSKLFKMVYQSHKINRILHIPTHEEANFTSKIIISTYNLYKK